jgi:hypothetical protein
LSSLSLVRLLALLVSFGTASIASEASAATLFDTGLVPCNCGGLTLGTFRPDNKVAGRFTLPSDAEITSLSAFVFAQHERTFTISIYGDGEFPDQASEYYSGSALTDALDGGGAFEQWEGISGLSLLLPAGSYWFTLETRPGNDYDGGVPTKTALVPADAYSYYDRENGVWISLDEEPFAFRIEGELLPVPEPSAGGLLALGISLLAARVRLHRPRRTGA